MLKFLRESHTIKFGGFHLLNDYFKATFPTIERDLGNIKPLYKYLIIPLIMSEPIENAMDAFINENKSYLHNSFNGLNNEFLPFLDYLSYPQSLRYQKLKLCLNILFNKFEMQQELHLQTFLEDLLIIGYEKIYAAIKNTPPTQNYFDEFYNLAQKFKTFDAEDEVFYFSNILLYVTSKYKYLEKPDIKEVCEALASVSDDWFEGRELSTLKIQPNDTLYKALSAHTSCIEPGKINKSILLNSTFLSENCLHFFACIHTNTYIEYTNVNLIKFKEIIFANREFVQARAFINFVFNFQKDIGINTERGSFNSIDQIMYEEYLDLMLISCDLESLLNNTFLTQQDLNQLYLQQISKGNIHHLDNIFKGTLNTRLKDYSEKDMDLVRGNLLRNLISLCQALQQKYLEEKYLALLVYSTKEISD